MSEVEWRLEFDGGGVWARDYRTGKEILAVGSGARWRAMEVAGGGNVHSKQPDTSAVVLDHSCACKPGSPSLFWCPNSGHYVRYNIGSDEQPDTSAVLLDHSGACKTSCPSRFL